MSLVSLKKQEDLIKYKNEYKKLFLQFSATWCGPCKRVTPQIKNKFEQLNRYDILYIYIDIDKHKALSSHFGIKSIPTFFIYDKETDILMDPIASSDIAKLTRYCINNDIPLTECSY